MHSAQDRDIMQRFGFLYGGYSFQYWETVDMMRKLVIGGIPVFVAVQSLGSMQAVFGEVRQSVCLAACCTTDAWSCAELAWGGRCKPAGAQR